MAKKVQKIKPISGVPLLLIHGAWMLKYSGEAHGVDGGGFKHSGGDGASYWNEGYNFHVDNGECFGAPFIWNKWRKTYGSIDIRKLGAQSGAGSIHGVTVIYTAPRPQDGERVVVGWMRNATVYRKAIPRLNPDGRERSYFVRAAAADSFLISPDDRPPLEPAGGLSGSMPGQHVLFYPQQRNPKLVTRLKYLLRTAAGVKRGKAERKGAGKSRAAGKKTRLEKDILNTAGVNAKTERAQMILARIGQGQFRRDVMDMWDGRCAITGCEQSALLRASHIKPWSKSRKLEKRDPTNGLLLIAHLDAAFDSGLISFDDNGRLLASAQLSKSDLASLGLSGKKPRIGLFGDMARYMKYHRAKVFKR